LQHVVVRTAGDPMALAPAIRGAVSSVDSDLAVSGLQSLDALREASVADTRTGALMLGFAAAMALLLAATGLYAVLAYTVKERTHEIGVRMALGARPAQVVWELTRQGLVLTAFGLGVGVLVALALSRTLRSLLFGVDPIDPLALSVGGLTLGMVALLAAWVPARQAASVHPAVALREE
jgi:putative ABC transport system permease protein